MKFIEHIAANGYRGINGVASALLLSEGAEQNKIREWCQKNPHHNLAGYYNEYLPDGVSHCEGWEATLIWMAGEFSEFDELTPWDTASAAKRSAHSMKVARLARELANELSEEISSPKPYYPPVFEFFDENRTLDIVNALSNEKKSRALKYTKYSDQPSDVYQETIPQSLSNLFCNDSQELPDLLNRLADYAEETIHHEKPIARPNTGNANARAFALHMAEGIKAIFDRTPNEVIAACVCLRYPELENPPNADTIRDWRGAK